MIPDVSVDGAINLELVTLQLNPNNKTFTVLDITPEENNPPTDTPHDSHSSNGISIDFFGCTKNTTSDFIRCRVKVTNIGNSNNMFIRTISSELIDDSDQIIEAGKNGDFFHLGIGNVVKGLVAFNQFLHSDLFLVRNLPVTLDFITMNVDNKEIKSVRLQGSIFDGENDNSLDRSDFTTDFDYIEF